MGYNLLCLYLEFTTDGHEFVSTSLDVGRRSPRKFSAQLFTRIDFYFGFQLKNTTVAPSQSSGLIKAANPAAEI